MTTGAEEYLQSARSWLDEVEKALAAGQREAAIGYAERASGDLVKCRASLRGNLR